MTLANPPAAPQQIDPSSTTSDPAWAIAKLFPLQGHWNDGDYLLLNTNHLVEFSHGNIEVLETATQLHQDIVAFLYSALLLFVQAKNLGKVNFAPLPVKLFAGKFREPDVMFMSAERSDKRHNEYWDGADLVMEVVSDNDRWRDLDTKRLEYAQARISEYWIVDPQKTEITVLKLADDHYDVAGIFNSGSQAKSVFLSGFEISVRDVFDNK